MLVRYQVSDLPLRGMGAFCPTASTTPHASSGGREIVSGSPGTTAIPSPKPGGLPIVGLDPKTQGSNVSPDVIAPSIYIASAANMGPQVQIRHHNNMPVPALTTTRVPLQKSHKQRLGGRAAVPWPRTFQRWGSVGSTPAG